MCSFQSALSHLRSSLFCSLQHLVFNGIVVANLVTHAIASIVKIIKIVVRFAITGFQPDPKYDTKECSH